MLAAVSVARARGKDTREDAMSVHGWGIIQMSVSGSCQLHEFSTLRREQRRLDWVNLVRPLTRRSFCKKVGEQTLVVCGGSRGSGIDLSILMSAQHRSERQSRRSGQRNGPFVRSLFEGCRCCLSVLGARRRLRGTDREAVQRAHLFLRAPLETARSINSVLIYASRELEVAVRAILCPFLGRCRGE